MYLARMACRIIQRANGLFEESGAPKFTELEGPLNQNVKSKLFLSDLELGETFLIVRSVCMWDTSGKVVLRRDEDW